MNNNQIFDNDFREEELFKKFLEKQQVGKDLFENSAQSEEQSLTDDSQFAQPPEDYDPVIESIRDFMPLPVDDSSVPSTAFGKVKYFFRYISNIENARCLSALIIPGFLLLMLLINIVVPSKSVSEKENRTLAKFPEFSLSALAEGKFTKGFEDYISDQFVFRNSFVSAKRIAEGVIGKKDNHGILFCKDGYLIENTADISFGNVKTNLKAIEDLASVKRYNVVLSVVPTAYEVMKNKLPQNAYSNMYDKLYSDIKANIKSKNIKIADANSTLNQYSSEYLYYRTDHHQTALGSYYLYKALSGHLSFDAYPLSDFTVKEVAGDFYGTTWSNSGFAPTQADKIYKYTYKEDYEHKVTFGDENKKMNSLYSTEMLKKKDKYAYYLDGNHAVTEIKTSCPSAKSLAIIKDSYAHSLVPFLANHYSRIYMVDLRYFNGDIFEYLYNANVKDVLVLYNQSTFMTDDNLRKISAFSKTSAFCTVPDVSYGIVPEQEKVDNVYFDDAVFVGDSLTLGLSYFAGFNSRFLCAGGLSVRNIKSEVVSNGKNAIDSIVDMEKVGKVYIMLGTNDAVFNEKEEYIGGYSEFIDKVRERFPNAVIYIQSIMPVTKAFSDSHGLKNSMILNYNKLLIELAKTKQCYYIDVCSYFADEDGFLPNDAGGDGVHLSPDNYRKFAEYLKEHAVDVGGVKKLGEGSKTTFKGGKHNTEEIGNEIVKNVKFKDKMSKVGDTLALSNYNLDTNYVLSASLFVSGGSTAEEVAVFEVKSEEDVQKLVELVKQRVENKKKDFENYIPAEMTKLNNPFIVTKGNVVVLCLADNADVEKIKSFIK